MAHPDRVRRNYKRCEIGDEPHFFIIVANSDIAPFIVGNTRVMYRDCINCGFREKTIWTQEEFEKEMKKSIALQENA